MAFKIKLDNLKKYLSSKGWSSNSFNDKLDTISLTLNGETFTILIPNNENLLDYESRLYSLLTSLSSIESRDKELITSDITNFGYDLLKIRFEAEKTRDGTIPLLDFGNVIEDIQNSITYSACSELDPKSQYTRAYTEAEILRDNCKFAQTEIGSFIITIQVPCDISDKVEIDEEEDEEYLKDLGRRTIVRLISGIDEIDRLNLDDENQFRERYSQKLNKNICEALDDLIVRTECQIEISAKWNSIKAVDNEIISRCVIDPNSSQKFKKMASYLKKIPVDRTMTIRGAIKRLDRDLKNSTNDRTLILYSSDLKRNVRIVLDTQMFKSACDAMKDIAYVEISGHLNKKGLYWWLDEPRNFQVQMTINTDETED